jgi:hypothetical protein
MAASATADTIAELVAMLENGQTIVPERRRRTIFEVSDSELATADRYEPAPYKRTSTVLASGKRAWVYVDGRFSW